MRHVFASTFQKGFVLAALVAVGVGGLAPRSGEAAGYYNLGAFWRTQQPSVACTSGNGDVSTISQVQSWVKNGPTAGTSMTLQEGSAVSAGDTLIVGAAAQANEAMTVSDSLGNSWSQIPASVNAADSPVVSNVQLWYAPITHGGSDTVTLSVSSSTTLVLSLAEFGGIATSNIVNGSSGFTPSSATNVFSAGSVTASGSNSLVIGFFGDGSGPTGSTPAAGGVFTREWDIKNAGYSLLLEQDRGAAAGVYAPTGKDGGSTANWAGTAASFNSQCVLVTDFTPVIASISPNGSAVAGGEAVTITGNYFDSGATVTIGGNPCTGQSVSGFTQISCTAPSGASGAADVVVTDSDGHTGTLASGYLYGTVGSQSWLGAAAQGYQWNTFPTGSIPNFLSYNGVLDTLLSNPLKIAYGVTGGTGSLYVVDWNGNNAVSRVMKFNAATGAEVGWIGTIGQIPTGDPYSLNCEATDPWLATPAFCSGGATLAWEAGNVWLDGELGYPVSVGLDSSGSTLYVADFFYASPRVNKFNAVTGAFEGWIGYGQATGGSAGCPTSGGSATTGWCLGADVSNINATAVEGGFNGPTDAVVDPSGTYLYVLDGSNSRVEQFNAQTGAYIGWLGAVTGPTSPTCASTNAGCTPGTAGQFSGGFVNGGSATSSSVSGGFNSTVEDGLFPYLYASSTYLYVSDPLNYRVERYSLPSGAFAGWLGWVGTSNGSNCTTTGAASGTWCGSGGAAVTKDKAGGFGYPLQISSDGTYLYVADFNNADIARFNLDGSSPVWIGESNSTQQFVGGWSGTGQPAGTYGIGDPGYAGGLSGPVGVTVDTSDGWLFAVDTGNHRINRYTLSSGAFNEYLYDVPASPTGWQSAGLPTQGQGDGMLALEYCPEGCGGVAVDFTNGYLYGNDVGAGRILKFNLSSGAPLGWVGGVGITPAGGSGCTGLSYGQATPGWCTGGAGGGGNNGDGEYGAPVGLAVDLNGTYVYVAEAGGNRVSRINASTGAAAGFIGYVDVTGTGCGATRQAVNGWCVGSGAETGYHSSGATPDGEFWNPTGIAMDPSGNYLYVAEAGSNRVTKINTAGVVQGWIGWGETTGAGNGYCPPSGGGTTTGWCLGGTTTPGSSAAAGGFNQPQWVVADANGYLWVSDNGNERIEQFVAASGAYVGGFTTVSRSGADSMGVDADGKTLIAYESFNGPKSFTRYSTATYAVLGELGYLANGSMPGGQSGCTGLSFGWPSLWCMPTDPSQGQAGSGPVNWGDTSQWASDLSTQIIVDSSNQNMYFEDTGNSRIVRVNIGN